jgi:hypothetical protein
MTTETREINNREDIIDSRDIIARIEYLTSLEIEDHENREALSGDDLHDYAPLLDEIDADELKVLRALADEGSDYAPDWEWGATLIRDTYFEDYARDLAEDIGAISKDNVWPATCINWERASEELKMDYSEIEFGGVTYWIR